MQTQAAARLSPVDVTASLRALILIMKALTASQLIAAEVRQMRSTRQEPSEKNRLPRINQRYRDPPSGAP